MAERHRIHLPHHHSGDPEDLDDFEDDAVGGGNTRNPYASANRWRHQESKAFARHAAAAAGQPRDEEDPRGDVKDLTAFLNASRITPSESSAGAGGAAAAAARSPRSPRSPKSPGNKSAGSGSGSGSASRFTPIVVPASADAVASISPAEKMDASPPDGKEIIVGPLLNYRRMENGRWVGSALVVTRGGGKTQPFVPTLLLGSAGTAAAADGPNGSGAGGGAASQQEVRGTCLYSDPRNTFWRFDLVVPMGAAETRWQYSLPDLRYTSKTKPRTHYFFVPAITEAMRIMFFSCNGFSVGTDEDAWSGPALWNDVMRYHAKTPFHVMIGGGDQIYNDSIRVSGPLHKWTTIGNPKKRHNYPFPESLRQECDDFYLQNYIRWYSTEPFAAANGQIAQLNIWDDHDIIDGFGSYVDDFMKCDVFRGIGGTAHKYYMLFQHHLPPPPSTYTSDRPGSAEAREHDPTHKPDPVQLLDTYVAPAMIEPNYIIGPKPGPYVAEHSHNMYCKLGARVAFLGIDARTERTRHQVNYPETYDLIFNRLAQEFRAAAAAGEPVRHLILLLGIPIAYPRLTWLENIFNSPLMGPVKFMNRRFGLGGGFFNQFDGSVDLLDDLDDHYTARTHKKERNWFVEKLQTVSAEHSVRITILGGDVHLAALGRFYAKPNLDIPSENDYRLMINVISSAITNKPPPAAIANLLARRNIIHHLNSDTDETLFKLFNKDPGTTAKTSHYNHVTMPSRNYAIITENSPNNPATERSRGAAAPNAAGTTEAPRPSSRSSARFRRRSASRRRDNRSNGTVDETANGSSNSNADGAQQPGSNLGVTASAASAKSSKHKNGHYPLSAWEDGAGTEHKAARQELHGRDNDGSLDVCIRVEIDQHDREGHTLPYGMSVPALDYNGPPPVPPIPHNLRSSRPSTAQHSGTSAS